MQSLSEEEKAKVLLQVDHFVQIVEDRSGLTFAEVVDVIRWSKNQKAFVERLQASTAFAIIGVLVSALLYAVWRGFLILHNMNDGGP